jgi:hypothetical protein
MRGEDMNTVNVTLTREALQGLNQRDTVGAQAADGRERTLHPQHFSAEELETLAEGGTVRKRDGATVLAIVVQGSERERTMFQDVYAALASSGQVWDLEPQEDRSAILLVHHGERYLVTVNREVPSSVALARELVALAEQRQAEDRDFQVDVLDELVHDCASKPATDINNAGLAAQITFLLERLGEQQLRAELAKEDDDG